MGCPFTRSSIGNGHPRLWRISHQNMDYTRTIAATGSIREPTTGIQHREDSRYHINLEWMKEMMLIFTWEWLRFRSALSPVEPKMASLGFHCQGPSRWKNIVNGTDATPELWVYRSLVVDQVLVVACSLTKV